MVHKTKYTQVSNLVHEYNHKPKLWRHVPVISTKHQYHMHRIKNSKNKLDHSPTEKKQNLAYAYTLCSVTGDNRGLDLVTSDVASNRSRSQITDRSSQKIGLNQVQLYTVSCLKTSRGRCIRIIHEVAWSWYILLLILPKVTACHLKHYFCRSLRVWGPACVRVGSSDLRLQIQI